jgi:hypothetical protein
MTHRPGLIGEQEFGLAVVVAEALVTGQAARFPAGFVQRIPIAPTLIFHPVDGSEYPCAATPVTAMNQHRVVCGVIHNLQETFDDVGTGDLVRGSVKVGYANACEGLGLVNGMGFDGVWPRKSITVRMPNR